MPKKRGLIMTLLWNHFKVVLGLTPFFLTVFTLAGAGVWKLKAEPAIQRVIDSTIAPLQSRIIKLELNDLKIDTTLRRMRFTDDQQLYLLKKIAGKAAVKSMEEDTEGFRPFK